MYTGTIRSEQGRGEIIVTQKEIAAILGVSRATVARALKNDENIKEETKKRVLELCEEVGYRKNYISSVLAAKNQKSKRLFAFLVRSKNENYLNGILEGINTLKDEISRYNVDLDIVITDIAKPEDQVLKLRTILKYNEVDGLIVIPLLRDQIEEELKLYPDISIVALDKPINEEISYIGSDYRESGRIIGGVFTKIFRKDDNLLILDLGRDNLSSENYLKGFLELLEEKKTENICIKSIRDIDMNFDEIGKIPEIENINYLYATRHVSKIALFLKDNNMDHIKIIANGVDVDTMDLINEERILFTTKENYFLQGYLAGKVAFNKLTGNRSHIYYKTKSEIVFKENIKHIEANHEKDIFKNFNII